jgi:hypothetical protein
MNESEIFTLAFYNNFGSVLQAYALQKKVRQFTGGNVDVANFRPSLPMHAYFKSEDLLRQYQKKIELFDEFRFRYLGMDNNWVSDVKQIEKCYENYITGSDIVWGKEFSKLDTSYFLDFVPEGKKRISYAASMILREDGHSEDDGIYAAYIPRFDEISVRETSSVSFIQQFTQKQVTDVLDPTLLLEKSDYEELVEESRFISDKPYILAYFLTHDPAVVDYTNILAKKLGLKVIHYFADYPSRIFDSDAESFAFAGPQEFLGYVKNAACIFTNSFHGTCFSFIFQKPFYTYTANRGAMLSRVHGLTKRLSLENRCFTDFRDIVNVTLDTDYEKANQYWQQEKSKSLKFLQNALGGKNLV